MSSIQLRPYQLDIRDRGVAVLKEHGLLYLAMEVRTGKTLTALAIAQEWGAADVLFVTKKKVISDIQAQYKALPQTYELKVVNYESLHKLEDLKRYDFVILDEAHCLGAFPKPSERTIALKSFIRDRPVVYLSGTPTPESWSQIFHQLWISQRSPFPHKNFYAWAKDYVTPKTRHFYSREVTDYSGAHEEPIRVKCGHLFISFTQEEAGFESVVEEEVLTVKMKPKTYDLVRRLKADRVLEAKDRTTATIVADTEAKLMQKMHQLYSGTVIADHPERRGFVLDYSKVDFIRKRFAGKKIAIFHKFIMEENMLLSGLDCKFAHTPEEFNATGPDYWYISQIQSGREGINLSAADAIVMYNIDYSAVSYWQARARLQTKDRTKQAKVYWIFSEGGIEHKIHAAVMEKKDYTLAHFKRDYLNATPSEKIPLLSNRKAKP
jgi:SNF2 family DNA or RNA helicase